MNAPTKRSAYDNLSSQNKNLVDTDVAIHIMLSLQKKSARFVTAESPAETLAHLRVKFAESISTTDKVQRKLDVTNFNINARSPLKSVGMPDWVKEFARAEEKQR